MWISWKHEDTDFVAPLTLEQKIDVFYAQTLGWQLHIADLVANGGTTFGEFKRGEAGYSVRSIRHSGFAVLHICLSYIELIGSLVEARRQSPAKTFEAGARAIPGLIDGSRTTAAVFARLYDGARCGLYHEGRTRPGVGLGPPPDGNAIASDPRGDAIGISPEPLPKVLTAHLEQLKRELLDPANVQLRRRFERRFDAGFTREPPNTYQAPLVKWGHVRCSPSKGTPTSMRQASRRLPVPRLRFHVCGAERPLHQTLIEALPPCPPKPEGIGVGRVWGLPPPTS